MIPENQQFEKEKSRGAGFQKNSHVNNELSCNLGDYIYFVLPPLQMSPLAKEGGVRGG
jgi:hypothetical protein